MSMRKQPVTFPFACQGAEAQRQVFFSTQAEPLGSLFLPVYGVENILFSRWEGERKGHLSFNVVDNGCEFESVGELSCFDCPV